LLAVCVCLHSSPLVIVAQQEILQESMTPIQPLMTILEWIPVMVDTVPLIIWLVYVALMKNFRFAKESNRGKATSYEYTGWIHRAHLRCNETHLQSCTIQLLPDAILLYLVLSTCAQRRVQSESTGKGIQIHGFQFNR
jgi:hypothetical protein